LYKFLLFLIFNFNKFMKGIFVIRGDTDIFQ
jgi:hypothetical protein